jgi:chemotaxis protein methyltransferase WspC
MRYAAVRRWLEEHALVEPSLLDSSAMDPLVAERLAVFGAGEAAYVEALARLPDEVELLMAGIAVPETWLFRYRRSFDLLLEFLERRLAAGDAALRMLSVGCATGQEPYCMAMTALQAGWPPDRVTVEGLDRNREFLATAAAGEYSALSIRGEIPAWAVPLLECRGDTVAIARAVRGLVRFSRADITDPAALRGTGPFQVIFCRNVLIYLNARARSTLLDSVCAELVPDGLLFVGHAEQMIRGSSPLRVVEASHAFALGKQGSGPVPETPAPAVGRLPTRSVASSVPLTPPVARASDAVPAPAARNEREESVQTARDLADEGRAAEGEAMVRSVIARRGLSADAVELLAMIRMSVNDTAGAKRLFEQAVYLEPSRSTSLLQLAIISERSGDTRRAASYWERARRASTGAKAEHTR